MLLLIWPLSRDAMRTWLVALLAVFQCGMAHAASVHVTVIDSAGQVAPDAVVFLESAAAKAAVKPLQQVDIGQQNKTFVPTVSIVTAGTAVNFPNRDTVRHHVYSFSPVKVFDIKLYVGTPAKPVVFDQAGIAVLGCNIHDNMSAWIVVVQTPWYAKTGANGEAKMAQVPPGKYRLRSWHPAFVVGDSALDQAMTVPEGSVAINVKLPVQVKP
jgi:plastocyanin